MFFQLSKVVGGLLMPLSAVLVLLVVGLALLRVPRLRLFSVGLLTSGTLILLLVSIPPFSERALAALEGQYPVLMDPPEAEWIVVLGGGSRGDAAWPAATRLGESSLYRLAEGVRLARRLPDARLVTSGGASRFETTANLMAQVAQEWDVEPERIVRQTEPRTTVAEAKAVAGRLEPGDRVILVTSALHMPRAVALFEGQGVNVIPAPAGHFAEPNPRYEHAGQILPRARHIEFAERFLWERIGLVWAKLRGQAG